MARFYQERLEWGSSAAERWRRIRDLLRTAVSVEVVALDDDDGRTVFELRAWTAVRKDGSNAPRAAMGEGHEGSGTLGS